MLNSFVNLLCDLEKKQNIDSPQKATKKNIECQKRKNSSKKKLDPLP